MPGVRRRPGLRLGSPGGTSGTPTKGHGDRGCERCAARYRQHQGAGSVALGTAPIFKLVLVLRCCLCLRRWRGVATELVVGTTLLRRHAVERLLNMKTSANPSPELAATLLATRLSAHRGPCNEVRRGVDWATNGLSQ
eukprot:CAMPEP_0197893058 /NCGR_PEP_ID=MMETSP1439-20131203/32501_1 /TAXON_ID=66791 /ORGANISM="Gonyaulax spinifera, Strain CCMP409" /LENGTH=137 /DNA_ID=CAMNT_0043513301 /DNA_START=233 /DNA_END=643 /DNA_ORIENTATION=+